MAEFRITVEITAVADLRSILRYITEILKEPAIARRLYSSIKGKIITLKKMPLRHPLVTDEFFAARGLRKMPAGNYFVFYWVDEAIGEVHVLRVLYDRREWRDLL
jgi:plasmid stabilization system protein ParE